MSPARPSLVASLLGGVAVLGAAILLARHQLPEWQLKGESPDELAESFRSRATEAGFALESTSPRLRLTSQESLRRHFFESLGEDAESWLALEGRGAFVEASAPARWRGGPLAKVGLVTSMAGDPWSAEWVPRDFGLFIGIAGEPPDSDDLAEGLASLLLHPGETLTGEDVSGEEGRPRERGRRVFELPDISPPQHIVVERLPGATLIASRRFGDAAQARTGREIDFTGIVLRGFPQAILMMFSVVLFAVLLVRRRIDLVSGALLASFALVTSAAELLSRTLSPTLLLELAFGVSGRALFVFVLWSAAESWLRATDPSFSTSLDALRVGRFGPRGGGGILLGLAAGGGLAGLEILTAVVAHILPNLRSVGTTVPLPIFASASNPFTQGPLEAGVVILAVALSRHMLPAGWAPAGAAAVAALLIDPVDITPRGYGMLASLLVASVLVLAYHRLGLTALLSTAVASRLLPATGFAALLPDWLRWTLVFAAGGVLLLVAVALYSLRQPPEVEKSRLAAPAFVRRIEEDRRLSFEMDLLARMQLGLLPETLPRIPGYELTARSILATEAGGDLYDFFRDDSGHIWVAIGDVSGHGYSCAIGQAMTKAALVSLVESGRTPCQVIQRIDRVLRTSLSLRQFTALSLLRFDPRTGEGLLSNAGHPFPLLFAAGEVSEIAHPGLPLGQGPARRYSDQKVVLPPGGVLVFCSDGFYEGSDGAGSPYGFDRPRQVLRKAARWRASEILEMLLVDWRHHVGGGAPPDDTTILVLKRN
jgi:serine phosphatase RsbU (regulator of sigma subunit)